jgi:hypothetical protein
MKHQARQVCAYVPRPPRRDRIAYAAWLAIFAAMFTFTVISVGV